MNAKVLRTSLDFEEVGDVLEGFEIADDHSLESMAALIVCWPTTMFSVR